MIDILLPLIPESSVLVKQFADAAPSVFLMLHKSIQEKYSDQLNAEEHEHIVVSVAFWESVPYVVICAASQDMSKSRVLASDSVVSIIERISPEKVDEWKAEIVDLIKSGSFKI
jgi:hypothetical protein